MSGLDQERCVTCSDEALVMCVLTVSTASAAICADARGDRHSVAIDLVEPVAPGDELLVHAGVAIARAGASA